ncbi:hypothetical protein [Butyrivibrio sp. MB2005]|nr:hypothetical protein [Butyrivibrio sp. MB2005]
MDSIRTPPLTMAAFAASAVIPVCFPIVGSIIDTVMVFHTDYNK